MTRDDAQLYGVSCRWEHVYTARCEYPACTYENQCLPLPSPPPPFLDNIMFLKSFNLSKAGRSFNSIEVHCQIRSSSKEKASYHSAAPAAAAVATTTTTPSTTSSCHHG